MKIIKDPMLREKLSSLRFRSTVLTVLPFFVLTVFSVFYISYAVFVVKDHSYEVNSRSLDIYMNGVEESMSDAEKYVLSLYTSSDLLTFGTAGDDIEFYKALSRLQSDMTIAAQAYKYIDCFFVYDGSRDFYFDGAKYELNSQQRSNIKKAVISEIAVNESLVSGSWISVRSEEEYYLVRGFRVRSTYLGCVASVEGLCGTMRSDGYSDYDYLTFFTNDGVELGNVLSPELSISPDTEQVKIDGRKYTLISRQLESGEFSAVGFIDNSRILAGLRSFGYMIALWLIMLVAFLLLSSLMMHRWVTRPIVALADAMNHLKAGDLDVQLSTGQASCSEFTLLYETFADMRENIKRLKIDIYEHDLRRQEAELQYMKSQFKPHFYINCFNAINNLAIMNRNAQICEMTKYLGNEMRYIISSKTLDTLRREVEFTENYLRIQELCYGSSVQAHFEIEPSVYDVPVPPLVILTFVGNVYKHQAMPGTETDVFVVCSRSEENEHCIKIEIWDTGEGYPDHVLKSIAAGEPLIDDRGEHFGIKNIISRIKLIYGDSADVRLQNHFETGGAYTMIELPDDAGI